MWTLALTLLLVAAKAAAGAPVPAARYEFEATLSAERRQIDGTVDVWFTNTGRRPQGEAVFLLLPNRFASPDEGVNDFNRPFVYPEEEFSPGSMRIVSVHDGTEVADGKLVDPPGLPAHSVLSVPLAPAVPPGATRHLTLRFRTEVPHRFGSFGEFEGQLTLLGGWHPYLAALDSDGEWQIDAPPPVADFDVTLLSTPELHVVLNGRDFAPGEPVRHVTIPNVHYVSLIAAPDLQRTEVAAGDTHIVVLERPARRVSRLATGPPIAEILLTTLRDIIDLRPAVVSEPTAALVVVEAPLRLDLSAPGEGAVVISDRALKVNRFVRPFHEAQLAQGVYEELLRPRLTARESADDYGWVSEGLSRALAERFVAGVRPDNRSVHDWIGRFNIFSIVDRFESQPKIPFVGAFFDRARVPDPLHAQITTFNNSRPPGHVVMGKLRDLVGPEKFDEIVDRCSVGITPFRDCAGEVAPDRDIAVRLDEWTLPYPTINYRFESVDWNQPVAGGNRTTATVRRDSSRPFHEPVKIRLQPLWGEPVDLPWDGQGETGQVAATTSGRMHQALIDPEHRLIEERRDDNALPRVPQIVLDTADVEVTSTEFGLSGLVVGRHRYDYRKDLALSGFFTNRSLGFTFGPRWHGGPSVDATTYRHNLYAFYGFQALDEGFKDKRHPSIRTNGQLASLGLRYDYTNVFWPENPTRQRQARLFVDWYDRGLGGDFDYLAWGYNLIGTHPLWNNRNIGAVQVLNGFSEAFGNSEVPNQGLYSLGGSRSIRGIGVEEELAQNILVLRTELRHMVYPEVDLNLLDLLILRRGQLRLFADSGRVSNSPGKVYNPAGFATGFGIGTAAVYEFLGFFPAVAYIEIATRVENPSDVQFLFGTRQSF